MDDDQIREYELDESIDEFRDEVENDPSTAGPEDVEGEPGVARGG